MLIERNSESLCDAINGRFKLSILELKIRTRSSPLFNNKKCTDWQFFTFNKSTKNIKYYLTNKIIAIGQLTRVKYFISTNINIKESKVIEF